MGALGSALDGAARARTAALAALAAGVTAVVLGILVDVARVVGGPGRSPLVTHLVIVAGGLVAARAMALLTGPLGRRSPSLRIGQAATAFLVLGAGADLLMADPGTPFWLTPPRAVMAVSAAALILVAAAVASRPASDHRTPGVERLATVHLLGLLLLLGALLGSDYLGRPNLWRSPQFYLAGGAIFPALLAWAATMAAPWGATVAAGWYMVMAWAVPAAIVVADPAAGPPLLAPPPVLVLLLLPALGVDLAARLPGPAWLRALVGGGAFIALLLASHWPAATAALDPSVRELYPALGRWPMGTEPDWPDSLWLLYPGRRANLAGLTAAAVLSVLSAFIGFRMGSAARAAPLPGPGRSGPGPGPPGAAG